MSQRRRSFYPFLLLAFSLLGFGYAYLASRVVLPLSPRLEVQVMTWIGLAIPFLSITWLPLVHWRRREERLSGVHLKMVKMSYLSMGVLSFLVFAAVVRDLALGIATLSSWRQALSWLGGEPGALSVLVAAAVMLAWAYGESRRTPRVKEVRVPVEGLKPELEGFRIVQISDLHVGHTVRKAFVERVVATINGLNADVVALTGDIVDGNVSELASEVEPLRDMKARDGLYYVTGNHEYYWGVTEWVSAITNLGIVPLISEHRVISRGSARLLLAGVPDYWGERFHEGTDAGKLAELPSADFRMVLAHQPKSAFKAASQGYDLQISGHTHGGQFLPWTLVIPFFQPFVRGLNRCGKMWLYVSQGTGSWGPPLRLGAPSEITLLVLTEASKVKRPRVHKSLPIPSPSAA